MFSYFFSPEMLSDPSFYVYRPYKMIYTDTNFYYEWAIFQLYSQASA